MKNNLMSPLNRWVVVVGLALINCSMACSSAGYKGDLSEHFGGELVAETAIAQGSMAADFDGDLRLDWVVAVKTDGLQSELPKSVRVIDIHNGGVLKTVNTSKRKGGVALAVMLSSEGGARFLIVDPKQPSLMGELYSSGLGFLTGSEAVKVTEEFSLNAKGDLIIIPTGAGIDTYLYWDGQGFRYFEPDFIP